MEQYWLPSLDYLKTILKFNLSSVIDILIVAFVVYKLMLLIKGTRAVQLIKGLAVLLVATALSNMLNLYTMNWLLRQAMTALVVALPVVFQPELRRALEKLGRGKFLSYTQLTPLAPVEVGQVKVIAEITRSVMILSKNKIGALIVIERETGLGEHIDNGLKIDGIVSAEFLVNIFIPKTPLHDGAVIIRGDRVAAAACFLPLSESPYLTSGLGTRHRAGIGISEHSDAVAVIVSEETGTISIAVEGALNRNLDESGLQEKLTEYLNNRQGNSLSSLWHRR
ncbi:MAG: DNA integrity scanning protein DisA [Pelotomaculum sp. PtaB.Bin013]|uniref:Diadenylate cyclase n=1 Tax=Pelotomaculum isophthalicicum JI TaxID=947010 RepID=A0A9X4JW59_9FIRM|nr:diadenylate cyclase CdaA [Pelotomaculum isophthalicicum]MDF9408533.1 diadenylate cyclase CdaA [Pelotomaculum isophthalicicum JI]OPX84799.1 MAG: DNA integrity scanning protein DisA [Pelotomaculum sp. PtaB.Bin013]